MCILLIALFIASVAGQCPYAYTPLNGGTLCSVTTFCQALGGDGYQCMNGQCCRVNGLCNSDEISVGFDCLKIVGEGGRCTNSAQCIGGSLRCVNGRCSRVSADSGVTCSKPGQVAERRNGALQDCMYNACGSGYGCEYNQSINQYICCGVPNRQRDPPVTSSPGWNPQSDSSAGRVRMTPGTSTPFRCYGSSDCMFNDTPNCINSSRYGYFVCCSTYNC